MNEQKINRGTHGDSLLILVSLETLSKKPPLQAWNAKWWEHVTVVRLGIISYGVVGIRWYLLVLSSIIFMIFGMMFYRMTQKHCKRIINYKEAYRPIWNFFDLKAYIIMAIMMGGGIGLRNAGIFLDIFVAFFYTGLGCALFLAGVLFVIMFFKKQADSTQS